MNRMLLFVLLVAVMLLPLAQVNAQDGKKDSAIIKKLKAAVATGKLTEEQAKAKFMAVKKLAAAKDKAKTDCEEFAEKKLKAAVKAGKLTEEQAWEKWKAIKNPQASKVSKSVDDEAIGHKLKAAVKAGKLTEEQAKAKWVAIKKKAG